MTDDFDDTVPARLRLIAEALDLPAEYFFMDVTMEGSVVEATECLRLWSRITSPEGRRRALEVLRVLADDGTP